MGRLPPLQLPLAHPGRRCILNEPASRRARAPAAKEERRAQIKAAAAAAFDAGTPFAEVSMTEVSRRAGLAKGTSYLYFPSKEALFLEVLVDDLEGWFDTLDATVAALSPGHPEPFAEALADTLLARPRMLRLLALLHVVLEANLDAPTARAFKGRLAAQLLRADAALVPRIPGFVPGDVARLLLRINALVVGLAPMATPAPVVAAVLAEPELAWLQVDFRAVLVEAVSGWIRGWRAGA